MTCPPETRERPTASKNAAQVINNCCGMHDRMCEARMMQDVVLLRAEERQRTHSAPEDTFEVP